MRKLRVFMGPQLEGVRAESHSTSIWLQRSCLKENENLPS